MKSALHIFDHGDGDGRGGGSRLGGGQDGGQGRAQLVGGDNGPIQDPGVALQGPGARLEALGTVTTPTLSDLFVALMSRDTGVK